MPRDLSPQMFGRLFLHRVTHLLLSLVMLWLAAGAMFDTQHQSYMETAQVYSIMRANASPDTWAMLMFVAAIAGASTSLTSNWWARSLGSWVLCMMYFVIAAFTVAGNPHAFVSALFTGYAGMCGALAYSTGHIAERIPIDDRSVQWRKNSKLF
jgi:hypothetical protein